MLNIEIVKTVCALLDELLPRSESKSYGEQITYVTDPHGLDRRYAIYVTKIHLEQGWKSAEAFDSGVLKTMKRYLENFALCAQCAIGWLT